MRLGTLARGSPCLVLRSGAARLSRMLRAGAMGTLCPIAALSAALVTAGCAAPQPHIVEIEPYFLEAVGLTQLPKPGPLPDVQAIRAAFFRPIMNGCDELSCTYDLPRVFRIRALACEALPPEGQDEARALCRYERQLVPMHGEPRPWQRAETRFRRFTDAATPSPGWHVERDLATADQGAGY